MTWHEASGKLGLSALSALAQSSTQSPMYDEPSQTKTEAAKALGEGGAI